MALSNLNGKVLDDKYRIERQLGKGGMGAVYLATHLGTERPVALKVIAPQFMLNDEFVERFRREAKAAGRLHHPNVVNVTDFGFATVDDRRIAYLVMEYLDGCTLADILEEETKLPISWTVDIIEQACSALDEAHRQGIVHRDLKPDNLWLEPNRRGGYRVKVLDFGLAKLDAPVVPELGTDGHPRAASSSLSHIIDQTRPASNTTQASQRARETQAASKESQVQHSGDAATRMMRISEAERRRDEISGVEEQETLIQPPPEPSPADTPGDSQPAPESLIPGEEERTQVLDPSTSGQRSQFDTEPTDGLTRVGSVLGTPVYMSPEQCDGRVLDARSDIYSLAVITYQMLAGKPPFRGTMTELMKQHREIPPPPLRSNRRQISKRLSDHVMSALAKDPADRPQTAAGFASALRAYSEGTGVLIRRAVSLYSEHFPKFIRLSIFVFLPIIAVSAMLLVVEIMRRMGAISSTAGQVSDTVLGITFALASFVASSIVVGVTIRLVAQLNLAPLRPLRVRVALASLRKRLWPLLWTTLMVGVISLVGLALFLVPGIIFYINSTLVAPVVVMENLSGWKARRRSKNLVRRVRSTAIATMAIQYAIPMFFQGMTSVFIGVILSAKHTEKAPLLTNRIVSVLGAILNIFVVPLIASLTALLYLKARQAGGETPREAMSQFEEEDTPRTRWQMRMRERLSLPSSTGR
jgi:serine/threonine protein kinase